MKKAKKIIPLPFPLYFWTIAAVVIAGVMDSVYLSISHYRVYTDIAYESFCAISRSINCDTVLQSPYSVFIGVPVPVLGIIKYNGAEKSISFRIGYNSQKNPIQK